MTQDQTLYAILVVLVIILFFVATGEVINID